MSEQTNATGRPSKLNPQVQAKLIQAIGAGNTRAASAEYAGIGERTLRRWLKQGRDEPEGPFGTLLAAVKKAEADATVRNVAVIQTAAERHWTAAAWWLERRYPGEWGSDARLVRQLERQVKALEERLERGF